MATPSKFSVISEKTTLTGQVSSEDVLIVAGEVRGDVWGRKVIIKDRGRVLGNITCSSLVIEAGGIFDGQAFMGERPQPEERVDPEVE